MDGSANSDADQNVDPNPMHNLDDLINSVFQPFALGDFAAVIMIADGALVDKGFYLTFQLKISDQSPAQDCLKWSCFLGQVCGLAKMHLVCVHAAFRISAWVKYAVSGVRLSSAV